MKIGDATSTIFMVLIVFSLPADFSFMKRHGEASHLLEFGGRNGVESRLHWGVILLLGGGFALSKGCQVSGLSIWLGDRISLLFQGSSGFLATFLLCLLTATFTEFASNTATANVLIPILIDISKSLCKNPIFFAFSATISCSYAFMLPAATAPNAIVKGAADIEVKEMVKIGFVMNLICVLTTVGLINTYGHVIFDLDDTLPDWVTSNEDFSHCNNTVSSLGAF